MLLAAKAQAEALGQPSVVVQIERLIRAQETEDAKMIIEMAKFDRGDDQANGHQHLHVHVDGVSRDDLRSRLAEIDRGRRVLSGLSRTQRTGILDAAVLEDPDEDEGPEELEVQPDSEDLVSGGEEGLDGVPSDQVPGSEESSDGDLDFCPGADLREDVQDTEPE